MPTRKNEQEPINVSIESMPLNYVTPDMHLLEDFIPERKLFFTEDVYNASVLEIVRAIMKFNIEDKDIAVENRKPIYLYIQSLGGELTSMWTLLDMMNMSKTPIYTINMGVAASAASLIFMTGHKRFMFQSATVLIHEGSAQLQGDAIKVMDQSASYKKAIQQMKDYILEKTSIPKAQLMKKRANDWELDAQFCLENKVCDVIVENIEEII